MGVGNLPEILEGARTAGTLGLLVLAVKLFVDNRKLKLAENKDDREGWGDLIKALRDDVQTVRRDHAECQQRLTAMERELDGMRKQMLAQSASLALRLTPAGTNAANAADRVVQRLTDHLDDKDREK